MKNEIEIRKDQRPVLMKSGLVHWVSTDLAEKIQEQLLKQTAHTFIKIKELGISVNTAQIEGIYTLAEYEHMIKLKQGMWQCEYHTWHEKKHVCECKKESVQRQNRFHREQMMKEEDREPTPEERKRGQQKMEQIGDELRALGVMADSNQKKKETGPNGRTCMKCSEKLVGKLKYYCSGACVRIAKQDGTYGREEELLAAANTI